MDFKQTIDIQEMLFCKRVTEDASMVIESGKSEKTRRFLIRRWPRREHRYLKRRFSQ